MPSQIGVKAKEKQRTVSTKILVILLLFLPGFVFGENLVYKYQKLLMEKGRTQSAIEDKAWSEAKILAGRYVNVIDIEKPVTIIAQNERYLDISRRIKGFYDPDLNLVIATEYDVLVHEYLHAIFYLTGDIEHSRDESFIRKIFSDI